MRKPWGLGSRLLSWRIAGANPPYSFACFKKWAAAGRLQTGFLQLTFATPKPLVLLALKTVAKLTLCAIKKWEPSTAKTAEGFSYLQS